MKIFSKKNIFSMFLVFVLAVSARSATALAQTDGVFPLPNGKYLISVLGKYSSGSYHSSYIGQYVLGTGANSMPNSVMDIAASKGTSVYAVANGVIYQNNNHSGGGYNVVIKHDDGTYSYYGHLLNRSTLAKNTRVTKGQEIGKVGKSGSASGYHLHFEWSGHDVYCEFRNMGYDISIMNNSGASYYPHVHAENYYAAVTGTDGSLALNSQMKSGTMILAIPEGAVVTVSPDKSSGTWLYTTYNNTSGYCYYKYLVKTEQPAAETPSPVSNTYTAYVSGTDGKLAINSKKASGNQIGTIPECAAVTVHPDKSTSSWLYVTYNNVSGYSYYKYLTTAAPYSYVGTIRNTSGFLAINATPSTAVRIGKVPEGAKLTVYGNKRVGKWVWVEYQGVFGYAYSTYIK